MTPGLGPAVYDAGKEIQLWTPAVQAASAPLGATTSYSEDYRAWPVAAQQASKAPGYTPNPHKLEASTTSKDAYRAWPTQQAPPQQLPVQTPSNPYKFNATTTTSDDYRAYPIQAQQAARVPGDRPSAV